jgi:hypothetical protein
MIGPFRGGMGNLPRSVGRPLRCRLAPDGGSLGATSIKGLQFSAVEYPIVRRSGTSLPSADGLSAFLEARRGLTIFAPKSVLIVHGKSNPAPATSFDTPGA